MKDFRNLLKYVAVVTLSLMMFSCAEDEPTAPQQSAYETLTTYMSENNMDLSDVLNAWIIPAATVESEGSDKYYIMDIRKAEDFALGHIEGAVNTTLGNVLTEAANNGGKPILVVCYTGQSASHAVVALRLSGYTDAKVLKFGMSSWNGEFDKWTASCGDIAVGNANWTTDATAEQADFSYLDLTSDATDGAAILAERVQAMLAGGFKGVDAADVLDAPANYFINNYWAETDVDHYGHIVGAYRVKENLTLAADGFKHLDPSKTIVTYCWTGQTSSMITAYLTVLGFDAKSLKFGSNGMIHSQLESHKWEASADYDYVTGS